MSAYNIVIVRQYCHDTGKAVEVGVQFKYGDTWQHKFRVGDTILWGGNDVGVLGAKRVVIDGIGEPCPACGFGEGPDQDAGYEVWVSNDVITCVQPATGTYDFARSDSAYILLERHSPSASGSLRERMGANTHTGSHPA